MLEWLSAVLTLTFIVLSLSLSCFRCIPLLKAGTKTKGVAGGDALIGSRIVRGCSRLGARKLSFIPV